MGKGEIALYERFLLFPQCFQKACFPRASKGVIVWEWVNRNNRLICLISNRSELLPNHTHEYLQYYGQREKLRLIGREDDLEAMNTAALKMAREVADEHGCLMAGNICNSSVYSLETTKLWRTSIRCSR